MAAGPLEPQKRLQMTGGISCLNALSKLQTLCLYGTKVSGDIKKVRGFTKLQTIDLDNTKVTGEVCCLNALTSLQTFYFYRTKMTGGVRRIQSRDRIKLAADMLNVAKGVFFARNTEKIKRSDGMQNAAR